MIKKISEKDMIVEFKTAKARVDILSEQLKEAQEEFSQIEDKLLEMLEAEGKQRSAHYDGIGSVTVVKPRLFASYLKENEPLVFDYLRDKGLGDVIKETVNTQSLSSLVKGLIESGESIPEYINCFFKTKLKLN